MSTESVPTITEADIQKMLANVRDVAIDFNTVLAENRFLKERIAELNRLLERATGRATVPRHGLRYAEAAGTLKGLPGTPAEKAERLRRMMEARRA